MSHFLTFSSSLSRFMLKWQSCSLSKLTVDWPDIDTVIGEWTSEYKLQKSITVNLVQYFKQWWCIYTIINSTDTFTSNSTFSFVITMPTIQDKKSYFTFKSLTLFSSTHSYLYPYFSFYVECLTGQGCRFHFLSIHQYHLLHFFHLLV